ncbi:MAG: SDR family NAD(P)-dependent oxidoreductase [Paracoccaceae bacterium]
MADTIVLVGASRGIGAAAATHLAPRTRRLIGVSRTRAAAGDWLAADVATDEGVAAVTAAVGDGPLDALLFLGGVWEAGAFTDAYRFLDSPPEEIRHVIAVNLVAPILLARALAPALARATSPRIVLIGSLSGRDGGATAEVANTASKFGLRGAAQALDIALAPLGIAATVVNPGNVATADVEADIAEGRFADQTPVPLADLMAMLDLVLALSPAASAREIDLAQTQPG